MFKIFSLFFFLILAGNQHYAQGEFRFLDTEKESVTVPFTLVNNMIVLRAKVNGTTLSFIFDTGIKKSILFNLKLTDSLTLKNIQKLHAQRAGRRTTYQCDALKGQFVSDG